MSVSHPLSGLVTWIKLSSWRLLKIEDLVLSKMNNCMGVSKFSKVRLLFFFMLEDVSQNALFELWESLFLKIDGTIFKEREEIYKFSGWWNDKVETNFPEVTGLY